MDSMKLRCTYFPALDRFAISKNDCSVDSRWFMQYEGYTSLEYLRYVPLDGISLSDVDEYLLKFPQELCCEVTNTCNAHCRVCIANAPATSPTYLSSKVLATAIECLAHPIARITITGGEPTAHPHLTRIVAHCANTKAGVVLSTNGYKPHAVKRVLDSGHVSMVTVSLHGPRNVHDTFMGHPGSYARAIETIHVASRYAVSIQVLSVASGDTLATLPELSKFLSEFPISEHRISLVKPGGRNLADTVNYEAVIDSVRNVRVSHKISVKRRDQPFLLLTCLGHLEVRYEQSY